MERVLVGFINLLLVENKTLAPQDEMGSPCVDSSVDTAEQKVEEIFKDS